MTNQPKKRANWKQAFLELSAAVDSFINDPKLLTGYCPLCEAYLDDESTLTILEAHDPECLVRVLSEAYDAAYDVLNSRGKMEATS